MHSLLKVGIFALVTAFAAACAPMQSQDYVSGAGSLPQLRAGHNAAVYVTVDDKGTKTALKRTIENYLQSEKDLRPVKKRSNAAYVVDVRVLSARQGESKNVGGMTAGEGIMGGLTGAGVGGLAGLLIGGRRGALIGAAGGAAVGVGAAALSGNKEQQTIDTWEMQAEVRMGPAEKDPSPVLLKAGTGAQGMTYEEALTQLEDRIALKIVEAFRTGN